MLYVKKYSDKIIIMDNRVKKELKVFIPLFIIIVGFFSWYGANYA